MKITQLLWVPGEGWSRQQAALAPESVQLVLVFGSREALDDAARFDELRDFYPEADIVLGSTSGEIMGEEVLDQTIVATAIAMDKTKLRSRSVTLSDSFGRRAAGYELGKQLAGDELSLVFVISDGQNVNGSELVAGLNEALGAAIPITGGLAGDGARFEKTLVGLNAPPEEGQIAAVGFYGRHLLVGHGSMGGWDVFGPERIVSRSESNVLYELDGKSALNLYKSYLGERAKDLPGSALLFPLSIREPDSEKILCRTVLSVDEAAQSMTFAGDIPEGAHAQLMTANFDRLIDGATVAAEYSLKRMHDFQPELAILISCVGRKLVLGQRVEEEVEEAREILGADTVVTGFYSYGELSPLGENGGCELHNQTMTITALAEV